MKTFEINKNHDFLMKRMGDISQLAGLKRYEMLDGKARGVEAVDFKTGTGFQFTVLPGRGMDIAWASYQGVPISYMSKTGIVSPAYYNPEGMNWLRSFLPVCLQPAGSQMWEVHVRMKNRLSVLRNTVSMGELVRSVRIMSVFGKSGQMIPFAWQYPVGFKNPWCIVKIWH